MTTRIPLAPPRETWTKLWAKTAEWRVTGILLGAVIGFAVTGSWKTGAIFGGVYNVVRMLVMPLRDRAWNRVRWGIVQEPSESAPAA